MHLRETLRADDARFRELAGQASHGTILHAFLHPRVAPVTWLRIAAKLHALGFGPLATLVSLLVKLIFKVEVPARAEIGPGFVLPHPMGVIIGSARIGRNVTIFQNVTLGARCFDGTYDLTTRPVIEDDVIVGAGAVVLGPVTVGANATVAANSLVITDVPPGATVLGVPAQAR